MITYEVARNYKPGNLVKLDLPENMEECLRSMYPGAELENGKLYELKRIDVHDKLFVLFEIQSKEKKLTLGSHLFSKM